MQQSCRRPASAMTLEEEYEKSTDRRLRRVLTDHPPSGSSMDPASVAV